MALGGGTFLTQNKILSGAYVNFVSVLRATAATRGRGYTAMALELDWGKDGEIFEVTSEDFRKDSRKIFGYDYTDEKMKGLRDLFSHTTVLYAYKLTSKGEKATNTFATARYCGERGNDLKIAIQENVDNTKIFDVSTYLGNVLVDQQSVTAVADLLDNDYVTWKKEAELAKTAATPLTGGTNGVVDGECHQDFLSKLESYPLVNAVGAVTAEDTVAGLYAAYVQRMRDEVGVKLQAVLYNKAADQEGVINVKNKVRDSGWPEASLVYWVTGAAAGCEVNASNTNKKYDGSFDIEAEYTQSQLEKTILNGEFTFHKVGDTVRVLKDINSLVTTTLDKGELFKSNQTIRVIDQIATDIAGLFADKYLGVVQNDADGRASLWSDIVYEHRQLQDMRAIEEFDENAIVVTQGNDKGTVVVTDVITVVNAMDKLYMTVTVQ